MKDILDLIARILISCIFFYEAYDSVFYAKATKALMTEYGLTWNQDLLYLGGIFVLVLGGTLVLIGYRSGLGASLLLLYWIPVTFIVHSFWKFPIEEQRIEAILFMKNLAIIGGLLMIYVNGSGRFSVKRLFATTKVPYKRN